MSSSPIKICILLCGQAGCGKDTLATYLTDKYGFEQYHLAIPMREACAKHHNLPISYFTDRAKKDTPIIGDTTPRDLMIEYAEAKRKENSHYFTQLLVDTIKSKPGANRKIVVADARKIEEKLFLTEAFGNVKTVWIHRPQISKVKDNTDISSEECDVVVKNDKTPFDGEYVMNQLGESLVQEIKSL